jgi:hypothetical protein
VESHCEVHLGHSDKLKLNPLGKGEAAGNFLKRSNMMKVEF